MYKSRNPFEWPEAKILDSLSNEEYEKLCSAYLSHMNTNFPSTTKYSAALFRAACITHAKYIPRRKTPEERKKEKQEAMQHEI